MISVSLKLTGKEGGRQKQEKKYDQTKIKGRKRLTLLWGKHWNDDERCVLFLLTLLCSNFSRTLVLALLSR